MRKKLLLTLCSLVFFLALNGQGLEKGGAQSPVNLDSLIYSLTEQVDSNQIRHYMQSLEDFGSRYLENSNRYDIALWIQKQFEDVGLTQTSIEDFEVTIYGTNDTTLTQYNVSAILPGVSDSLVLVGAHYDSYGNANPIDSAPGADDNASGTAGVLEMARIFASNQVQPYYTMVFVAFGAEETKNYSSYNGAQAFADMLIAEGRYVQLMLNFDMIANNDNGEMGLEVHRAYEGVKNHNWVVGLADTLAKQYTDLKVYYDTPPPIDKTDDLPFADAGFKTVYFEERDFSPNYHSHEDLVVNCELDFCAEVIKLGVATFVNAAYRPDPVSYPLILSEPDGSALSFHIYGSASPGLRYRIKYGIDGGQLDNELLVNDTVVVFEGLSDTQKYRFDVAAVNSLGYSSLESSVTGQLLKARLDQGILIINASDTNLCQITNDSLDRYYEYLTEPFVVTSMRIDTVTDITTELLSSYSTVLIHSEERASSLRIPGSVRNVFRNYSYWGGNLFLSLYEPVKTFALNYENTEKLNSTDFLSQETGIDSVFNQPGKVFHYLWGAEEYPQIRVDENKLAYGHLFLVEAYKIGERGEEVFKYGSDYDSTTYIGEYHGKSVASFNVGEDKNVFVISVPLYYLETEACKEMTHHILRNKFGEFYVNTPEINNNPLINLKVYPNPAKENLNISWSSKIQSDVSFKVYDLEGRILLSRRVYINNQSKVDLRISHLKPGVYLYGLTYEGKSVNGKFTKL